MSIDEVKICKGGCGKKIRKLSVFDLTSDNEAFKCECCHQDFCEDCVVEDWENTGCCICIDCKESGAAQEMLLTETETSNDPAAQYVAALCREKIAELKVLTDTREAERAALREYISENKSNPYALAFIEGALK